jgi:hypothetical protein
MMVSDAMNRQRGDNVLSPGSPAQAKSEMQSTATFTPTPERSSISLEASGKKTRPTIEHHVSFDYLLPSAAVETPIPKFTVSWEVEYNRSAGTLGRGGCRYRRRHRS